MDGACEQREGAKRSRSRKRTAKDHHEVETRKTKQCFNKVER